MDSHNTETVKLEELLNSDYINNTEEFILKHTKTRETFDFSEYITDIIKEKGLKKKDIIARSGLAEKYGYKLLNGEKKTTDRDKILAICIAAELNREQMDRALKIAGFSPLYIKDTRDMVILLCINKRMHSVHKVNEALEDRCCDYIEC